MADTEIKPRSILRKHSSIRETQLPMQPYWIHSLMTIPTSCRSLPFSHADLWQLLNAAAHGHLGVFACTYSTLPLQSSCLVHPRGWILHPILVSFQTPAHRWAHLWNAVMFHHRCVLFCLLHLHEKVDFLIYFSVSVSTSVLVHLFFPCWILT